jgi:hypothetical protein
MADVLESIYEFFEKYSENAFSSPKRVESKHFWYHQKVLHKSFPMNGHVSRLQQS